ncbi:MAG: TlpA disulfide reductase family protein [Bacteroidota bacterium]|nr:TlpA disulfide reductase family protein [Bacteroidota bacterium]
MIKQFLKLTVVLLLFSNFSFAQKSITISGTTIEGQNIKQMYIEHLLTQTIVDTADVENNTFKLKVDIEKSDYYKVYAYPDYYILIVPKAGEKIELTYDMNQISTPNIEGSVGTQLFYKQIKMSQEVDQQVETFRLEMEKKRQAQIVDLIEKNKSPLISLVFVDELSPEEYPELFNKLAENLKGYEDNEMVSEFLNKVNSSKKLAINSMAPEIDLPSPDGENIKLSSLRGQYVLIDFWAAWCRPCRMESPNLVKAYKKYHDKGFEIYSVSLDQTKDDWVNAIENDMLQDWVHVSDLKYWNSVAAEEYNVTGIPFSLLIDKKGKIIAKNLRGEKLQEKLAELLD